MGVLSPGRVIVRRSPSPETSSSSATTTPAKAETVVIVHEGRSLGAAVNLKGDEPDPMRIVLQPTGTVTGRLLDEDGKPRAGAALAVNYHIWHRGGPMMQGRHEPLTPGPMAGSASHTSSPGWAIPSRSSRRTRSMAR